MARELRHVAGVTTLRLSRERCAGCARCVEVCPHAVLAMVGRRAEIVERDGCMECGACAKNCASDAIEVDTGVGCALLLIGSTARAAFGSGNMR